MDCSTSGFPILLCLPEVALIHVHWVNDAIQPIHPLSSPSPSAFNLSLHQGLFQWISSSHQMAKVLKLQHQSFQWTFRVPFRIDWSHLLAVQRTLRVFSNTIQKYQVSGTPAMTNLVYWKAEASFCQQQCLQSKLRSPSSHVRLWELHCTMVCLGNELRSFCHLWECTQVLHFKLFCWLWGLLHF